VIETALETAILVACAVPAARVLATPAARRELRARPALALALTAGAVVLAGGIALAALESPPALRALTGIAVLATAAFAWRAHPRYGARRGLPPGSLGLRRSLLAISDRGYLGRQAQQHGSVFKVAQFHHGVVCVVGLAAGRELLRRHGDALRPAPLPLSGEIPRGFLRYMDAADYETHSPRFRAAFSAAVRAAVPEAERRISTTLTTLADASREAPNGIDPHGTLAELAARLSQRLLFGSALDGQEEQLDGWCRDAAVSTAVGRPSDTARSALRDFSGALAEAGGRRELLGESSVWSELRRAHPDALDDPTVLGNLFVLQAAACESVSGLLRWALAFLGEAPAWAERLRREPRPDVNGLPAARDGDPAAWTVLETLRLAQSEYVYRLVVRPINVAGFRVPRGWMLRLCVAESHLLDPPFAAPAAFDPARFEGRRFAADELSPFGLDQHACTGARMSLLFGRLFVEELVHGYDVTVVSDGPPERGNRHWLHWEPSSRLRVVLTPRGAWTSPRRIDTTATGPRELAGSGEAAA
jgi:cytochrome P450